MPLIVHAISYTFTVLFVVEVLFRTWALGVRSYFFDDLEKNYNRLDAFIALTSALHAAASFTLQSRAGGFGNRQVFRFVRTIRVLRVLRIVRAMRMFKGLRILMQGVGASVQLGTSGIILLIAVMWTFLELQSPSSLQRIERSR